MNEKPKPDLSQTQNPYENVIKRADAFAIEMKKLQPTYEDIQKKLAELSKKEKDLQKERESITDSENKLENNLISLLQSVHSFLKQTIAYSSEVYRRNQAEIKYWVQAEAAQRALAESAQKVLRDTSQRASAEVEYRKKVEETHKNLLEQTLKFQSEAAQRVKAEISKTGSIILDTKRVSELADKTIKETTNDVSKKVEADIFILESKNDTKKEQEKNSNKKTLPIFSKKE